MPGWRSQGLGVFKLSWEIYLNAGPAYVLSLSFPERGRDLPFSFPAHGVITDSGNRSAGALGTSICQEARNQCQHFHKNNPGVVSLLLIPGNHWDLDGVWTVSLNQDSAFYSYPGRTGMERRTTKVSVKKWVALHLFLAKEPYGKSNIFEQILVCAYHSPYTGMWLAHGRII